MQTNIRTGTERLSQVNPLYTLSGISALLYVVVSLAAIALTDWNNPAAVSTPAMVLGVLGFVAMLPVVVAVYQHLRPASTALSSVAVICGVLALTGAAIGTVVGYDSTLGIVSGLLGSFGMLLFFGLSGYLALRSSLLPSGWAYLSILLGMLAGAAGVISGTATSSSDLASLAWTSFNVATLVWALWTAVELIRRGRTASAGA
ncbi:MAG TPA: hypothetical protein VND68_00435 [Chloroflexia bacterium]|nr:hypothetical protein [Chloroflexia bacterium]